MWNLPFLMGLLKPADLSERRDDVKTYTRADGILGYSVRPWHYPELVETPNGTPQDHTSVSVNHTSVQNIKIYPIPPGSPKTKMIRHNQQCPAPHHL